MEPVTQEKIGVMFSSGYPGINNLHHAPRKNRVSGTRYVQLKYRLGKKTGRANSMLSYYVEVRRFELPTPTSLTWCANRAALHLENRWQVY